jgi:hypothetical protein
MRKLMVWVVAAFLFASCDNLKTKDSSSSEDDQEETTKKKKKAINEEDALDEEVKPVKKKKAITDDDEPSDEESATDDETTSDYSDGWSSSDQNKFMTNCTETASKSMAQERAENYCDCMMKKIEKRYPNSAEVNKLSESEITKLAKTCL